MTAAVARRAFDEALGAFGEAVLKSSMDFLRAPTDKADEASVLGQVDVNLAMQRLLAETVGLCAAMLNEAKP